ncbi:MAG TPA: hypothetical protein VGX71_23840 [Pseudaminobacter sp.]|nr:hypothetical protein [Pseudaminobacter sp.]
MTKSKSRPLFGKKRRLSTGFKMPKPSEVQPSKPIKGAPPLPFDDEMEEQGRRYFAKAALRDMREKLNSEDL